MPRLPRVAIPRRALLQRLRAATAAHVTLVVAAAGSGKSVLLVQLATTEADRRVVWLALEPADRDPTHLAHHILDGLRSVVPDLGPGLERQVGHAGDHMGTGFVTAIADAMAELPETLFVIDDLQVLGDGLRADVARLVARAPDTVHFVVASRVDPSAAFVRLEIAGELERFEQADLALTADEEGQVVERVCGVDLDGIQRRALHERTEGWAAATQVGALALRGHVDVDAFIESYQGDDRNLARYLNEEVFRRERPEVQDFLLRTSVVDRFCAPLCAVLTGRGDCQEVLDDLDRRSLLLVRLDNWHRWFRYHHLFAEMLRARLRAHDPDLERQLVLQAAAWHLERDDLFTAGELYVRAGDWDALWDLVLNRGWELHEQGYVGSTIRWTRLAPRSMLAHNQRAALAVATQARVSGNSVACDVLLADIESTGFTDDYAKAWVDMLHCIGVQFEEPLGEVLRRAEVVQAWLATDPAPPADPQLGALETTTFLGMEVDLASGRALAYRGRLDEARTHLDRARSGHSYWSARVGATGSLAHLEARAGELRRAAAIAHEALELAHECGLDAHEASADAYLALGMVARERNQLDEARPHLEEAGARAARNRRTALMAMHMAERSLLALALGDVEAGLEEAIDFRHEVEARLDPAVAARLAASEAHLWLAQKRPDRAEWLLGRSEHFLDTAAMGMAVALDRGDVATARSVLDAWPAGDSCRLRLERNLWSAALVDHLGDEDAAVGFMTEALRVAEDQGQVRTFLDAGPAVVGLVERCLQGDLAGYARVVLDAAQATRRPPLDERLTEREMTILQQLASLESNRAIAARLFISQNTLKTHLRRIYRKLGVANRRQAVHQAIEEGLIEA